MELQNRGFKRSGQQMSSPNRQKKIKSDNISISEQSEIVQYWKREIAELEVKLKEAKEQMAVEGGKLADLFQSQKSPNEKSQSSKSPLSKSSIKGENGPTKQKKIKTNSHPSPQEMKKKIPEKKQSSKKVCKIENIVSKYQIAHDMKPRAIVFNPKESMYFATSGFDGALRFWKYDNKHLEDLGALSGAELRTARFPTDLAWHADGKKSAALFPKKLANTPDTPSITNPQVTIFDTDSLPRVSVTFLSEKPHQKDPTQVQFLTTDKLITAGSDKQVILWNVNYDNHSARTQLVHSLHTSTINALCTSLSSAIIYSGGSDKRFISYSLENKSVIHQAKIDDKISAIRRNPINENLLLISTTAHQNQLNIFDIRTEQIELSLSYQQMHPDKPSSAYIIPSWSGDGTLVCSGSVDPIIHFWDVRKTDGLSPTQSFSVHKKRVLRAEFHPSIRNCLLTLSSDKNIGCHHFDIIDTKQLL